MLSQPPVFSREGLSVVKYFHLFSRFYIFSDFQWIYLLWSCPACTWESPLFDCLEPGSYYIIWYPQFIYWKMLWVSVYSLHGTRDSIDVYPTSSHNTGLMVTDHTWCLSLKEDCFCPILDGNQPPQMLCDVSPWEKREYSPLPDCLGPPTAIATGKFQSFA